MSESKGSERKRKVLAATLAVAMAATMLLSGTLAYFYRSVAVNEMRGDELTKNVIAHDDFDPNTGNKDVYVENLGTSPVFVRIRLTEDYWDSAQEENPDEATKAERPYNYMPGFEEVQKGTDAKGNPLFVGNAVYKLSSATDVFHQKYFSLDLGTTAQKAYLSAAAKADTPGVTADYYGGSEADAVNGKYLEKNVAYDPQNDGTIYTDAGEEDLIKKTGKSDGVLGAEDWQYLSRTENGATMEMQLEAAKKKYDWTGWVEDRESHWFYWSQPLMAGETTGLLLDQVTKLGLIADDAIKYGYHIHVEFEAVNTEDMGLWNAEKSTEASGDKWANAGNPEGQTPYYAIGNLLTRMEAQVEQDLDATLVQMENLRNEYIGKLAAKQSSSAAINLLNQGLLDGYNGKGALAKTALHAALTAQEEYLQAKDAHEADPTNNPDPDAPLIDLSANVLNGADENLAAFLVKTYGNDSNTLTYEQAKGISKITYSGKDVEAAKQITNLDFITEKYFPNLTYLEFRYATGFVSNTEAFGKKLPKKLTTLDVQGCKDLTKLNLSSLERLEYLNLFDTNFSGFGQGENQVDFDGEGGFNGANLTLKRMDLALTKFTSFDSANFPQLERVWLSAMSLLTTVKLENVDHLEALFLRDTAVRRVDLSYCKFNHFTEPNAFKWNNIQAVVIRDGQILQGKPAKGKEAIVKVLDATNRETVVRYEKWTSDGITETWSGETLDAGATAFQQAWDRAATE